MILAAIMAIILAMPTQFAMAKPAYPQKTGYMPKEFRGEWHMRQGPCGEFDNGSIAFTARRYRSFESVGRILRVIRIDADTIDVTMRVTHNGGTFGSNSRMQISADRKRLIVGVEADPDFYHRCTA
jgi:hypothetical protein